MSQMEGVLKNYVFKEEEEGDENFTKHFYISAMTTCIFFYLCIHHFSHISLIYFENSTSKR